MRLRFVGKLAAGVAAASLVTLGSAVARADARSEARGHFKTGMSAIADGRYDQGIRELERAYQILPHPNVLFNIARAYAESGDLPNALVFYQRYLESSPPDADAVKATVERLQARLERERSEAAAAAALPGQAPVLPPPSVTAPPGATPPPTPTSPDAPSANVPPPLAPHGPAVPSPAAKTEDVFAETVVTASKGAQSPLDAASSTSIITQQDIRLSGITKIPELLRRLASVDVMEVTGADTEVSLRGFNQRLSSRALVLIDGRSVFTDFIGSTLWQLLPVGVEDIERIEVVRGPGSALYGADAFNGVINIITKAPGEGGSGIAGGFGDHDLVHGSTWASGKSGDFSWRAAAGYDSLPRWSREVADGRQDLHLTSTDQSSSSRTERLSVKGLQALGKGVTVGLEGGLVNGTDEELGIGPLGDIAFTSTQVSHVMATLDSDHFEARVFWNRTRATFGLNAVPIGQSLLPGSADENVIDGEVQYKGRFDLGPPLARRAARRGRISVHRRRLDLPRSHAAGEPRVVLRARRAQDRERRRPRGRLPARLRAVPVAAHLLAARRGALPPDQDEHRAGERGDVVPHADVPRVVSLAAVAASRGGSLAAIAEHPLGRSELSCAGGEELLHRARIPAPGGATASPSTPRSSTTRCRTSSSSRPTVR